MLLQNLWLRCRAPTPQVVFGSRKTAGYTKTPFSFPTERGILEMPAIIEYSLVVNKVTSQMQTVSKAKTQLLKSVSRSPKRRKNGI